MFLGLGSEMKTSTIRGQHVRLGRCVDCAREEKKGGKGEEFVWWQVEARKASSIRLNRPSFGCFGGKKEKKLACLAQGR